MKSFAFSSLDSPIGKIGIVCSDAGVHKLEIRWNGEAGKNGTDRELRSSATAANAAESSGKSNAAARIAEQARRELSEYFARRRKEFTVPLDMEGTAFQKKVWRALNEIPYGQVRSYGEIARQVGNPRASRAVGTANGANPVAIIVPCHRVIAAGGKLGGYGGGLRNKDFLLSLEQQPVRA